MPELDLSESLRAGVLTDSRIGRNSKFCDTLENLKATAFGAGEYIDVTDAFDASVYSGAGITKAHPFPQCFRGGGVTLLCDETALYTVDESTWTITAITTYDNDTPTETKAIIAGGPWHFACMYGNWMLFNGSCIVINMTAFGECTPVVVDNITITTGCMFRGQLITGGFDNSDFYSTQWTAFWEAWASLGFNSYGYELNPPDSNWVGWSSIGGGDLLHQFRYDLAMEGNADIGEYGNTEPMHLEYARRNESNYMPTRGQGKVLCVKSMADKVMVYSEDTVCGLYPVDLPAPNFGLIEDLGPTGIASRGAVGGDLNIHLYIDNEGVAWTITKEMKLTRLGYQNVFSSLLAEDFTINFDQALGEFYISTSTKSYVYTLSGGLSRVHEAVSSSFHVEGGFVGVPEDHGDLTGFAFKTAKFDLGSRTTKTIKEIQVGPIGDEAIAVDVFTRDDYTSTFTSKVTGAVDSRGIFSKPVTGVEFQVELTGTAYPSMLLDTLVVVFDMDKENIGAIL